MPKNTADQNPAHINSACSTPPPIESSWSAMDEKLVPTRSDTHAVCKLGSSTSSFLDAFCGRMQEKDMCKKREHLQNCTAFLAAWKFNASDIALHIHGGEEIASLPSSTIRSLSPSITIKLRFHPMIVSWLQWKGMETRIPCLGGRWAASWNNGSVVVSQRHPSKGKLRITLVMQTNDPRYRKMLNTSLWFGHGKWGTKKGGLQDTLAAF
ncbi:hypothetical protein QBC46DRAFT_439556 [Diplogelasinospora grovesii]|uniref:Uncharacterized protein n=1 Tax=Diplogelasinospora grovesii TaxID=303347 RepID=A0AAN6N5D5_9PEZI|nr:hypothetical protein QBC46DRAFT_439556 [Diplogelasinospora grovesii]